MRGMEALEAAVDKMRDAGLGDAAIEAFREHYERLRGGDLGVLPENDIEPVTDVPELEELPTDADVAKTLDHAVVVKLNGGVRPSMGLSGPKSLLEVKDGLTFLDIIARQVLALRERFKARLPLVLLNSFHTQRRSLELLGRYPELEGDLPADFIQNRVPKLDADELQPVSWPDDPELEWAPPGHGDLYSALQTSGMLETLLEGGYRYAFVSNSDNLGAAPEPEILSWMAREEIPFVLEVTDRTEADRKGGHIATRRGGGLVLRESAQTPDEDAEAFEDVRRHRFFNTNNLWLSLPHLAEELERRDRVLPLPLIVNRKTVDPSDRSSPKVIQLETAMGAAIEVFDGARALRVPRRRFAPVKTTNDLLGVRSDAYALTDDSRVELVSERKAPPTIDLDKQVYTLLHDFEARFQAGPPSLRECERLKVIGDVAFGADVVVRGSVTIEHAGDGQRRIDDGEVLES